MRSLFKNNNLYFFLIILIFCVLIRGPFFQIINNDPDENSYLILSKLLAEYDSILYQDIWFDKLPLSALIFEKGYNIFGANFLLNKKKINKLKINYNEEFRTNGEDVNFSKVLKSKKCNLYYEPEAICYHYQFDNTLSLSKRYWRYSYYGAGLKKLTFIRLIKLIMRQIKVFFQWVWNDISKKNYHFFKIDFFLSYYFIIFCINKYFFNNEK